VLAVGSAGAGALPDRLAAAPALQNRRHRGTRGVVLELVWAAVILPARLLTAPFRL
jgi:hypothetical protein